MPPREKSGASTGSRFGAWLVSMGGILCGLFVCGCMTFVIYNARYGRKPINEVQAEMAKKLADRKLGASSSH